MWESFIFEFVPLRLGFTPSCNNPKSSFSSPVLHASNNLQSWCIRTVLPVRLFFFSIEFSEKKMLRGWNVVIGEFLSEKAHGQKEDGPKNENWTFIFGTYLQLNYICRQVVFELFLHFRVVLDRWRLAIDRSVDMILDLKFKFIFRSHRNI